MVVRLDKKHQIQANQPQHDILGDPVNFSKAFCPNNFVSSVFLLNVCLLVPYVKLSRLMRYYYILQCCMTKLFTYGLRIAISVKNYYSRWNVKWLTERQVAHPISLLFMNRNGWNLVSRHIFWRCLDMQNFSSLSFVLTELSSFSSGNH